MERLTGHFELDVRTLDALLGVERCFDMIARDLVAGGRRCRLYVVDGYGDDAVLERMIGFWLALPSTADAADAQTFIDRYVTFSEVNAEADLRQTATAVFLGKTLLLAEGYGECILIDAKSYPSRGVEEPSSGKVLRGAHDGFIETLVQNAALLRRRIRTPQLTLEGHKISEKSRADVVLCYLEDKRGLHLHVAGIHRGIHDGPEAMVQPFSTRSLYRAPRRRHREHHGGQHHRPRGQLPRRHDPAHPLL